MAQILALCRWLSETSLHVYARLSENVSSELVTRALQTDFRTVRTTNIAGQSAQPDAIDILEPPAAPADGNTNPPYKRREVTFDLAFGECDQSLRRLLETTGENPDL